MTFSKRTYIFFISLFCMGLSAFAQTDPKAEVTIEEVPVISFIRVGIDPSRYALSLLQPANRGGVEFSVDAKMYKKLYPIAEGGYTFAEHKADDFTFKADGVYGRIGMDYNMLNPADLNDHDAFTLGFRFAGSFYSQQADDVFLNNRYGSTTRNVPAENLSAYWTEITVGVKAEAFKNFYVGWTGRGKLRFRKSGAQMTPYIIPGYGRLSETSNFTADINIYILYAFSL